MEYTEVAQGAPMGEAARLRARARALRSQAQDRDRRATAIDLEADRIEMILNPVFARFRNDVWAGPAAGRAWLGYLDANRAVRRAAQGARAKAQSMRRESRADRAHAAEFERLAVRLDAAAAAAQAVAAVA